jgi:hypothetical protein
VTGVQTCALPISEAEEEVKSLFIDFSNKYIGGGVLSGGNAQEEILFCLYTECIVSLLLFERMSDNESIIIENCKRFNYYTGYAQSLTIDLNNSNANANAVAGGRLITAMQEFEFWLHYRNDNHNNNNNALTTVFVDSLNYDLVTLQNDYNHVLTVHQSNEDFHFMFGLLLVNNCDAETCLFLHQRQHIFSLKEHQPPEIRLKNELFFKLHLYFSHSYDFNYRLTPKEEQQLQQQLQIVDEDNDSTYNGNTPFQELVDHISNAKLLKQKSDALYNQEQHYQRFNLVVNNENNDNVYTEKGISKLETLHNTIINSNISFGE